MEWLYYMPKSNRLILIHYSPAYDYYLIEFNEATFIKATAIPDYFIKLGEL